MAPINHHDAHQQITPTHPLIVPTQTWQSQIICLVEIAAIVLIYTLACYLYGVFVGWKNDAELLDKLLADPPPSDEPGHGSGPKELVRR
ncbi:hypothetical protein FB45DRAFT_1038968 [Roridomyces roridus]|uniref:Uncharacterized protein n=1 Tax=Roridomyces roridus TaxID=1738132 RepID=A0AAD7B483_9AGAR|nr:hypothetical protein FB45DRAFT_1038968 [Roridomyces roridus]